VFMYESGEAGGQVSCIKHIHNIMQH